MSYAAFWIEVVVTSMLFTALTVAIAARVGGFKGWLIRLPNGFLFCALCVPAVFAGLLKYQLHLRQSWFGYSVTLILACVTGSLVIRRLGARRSAGLPRAAVRWKIRQIAAGAIACFVLLAVTLWNMDLEVRHRSDVVRATAGEVLLSVAPAEVPDSQNAATVYAQVSAAISADPAFRDSQGVNVFSQATFPNPADALELRFLTHQQGNVQRLRDAAKLEVCRFPHDYGAPSVFMMLPELNRQRDLAHLLVLDASYELGNGHPERAVSDDEAIFSMARLTSQGPYLISGLVAIGLDSLASHELESILPKVQNAADLSSLRLQAWDAPTRMMQRAWKGEEAVGLSAFADIGAGEETLQTVSMSKSLGPRPPISAIARLENLPYRLFLLDDDQRGYQGLMDQYNALTTLPYYRARPQLSSDEFLRIPHEGIMTALIAPAYTRMCAVTAYADAAHCMARVGIAVTRYRLDHAQLPDTLESLVPQYLSEVPTDPFDGKPLRYRKTAQDWRLYSVGRGGRDQGGEPDNSKDRSGNISFVVKEQQTK